jgi:hypothetical protein
VQLPPHRKAIIGSHWVFNVKCNADGSLERYKTCLVAKGFSQRPGLDYTETFAPTAKWAALRTVLAMCAPEDYEADAVDISNAFLNRDLMQDVYIHQPKGFEQGEGNMVLKLNRSLYGLKQASRVWYQKLDSALQEMGFHRTHCDHCVFVWKHGTAHVIMPVYDLTIISKTKADKDAVKAELGRRFKLRDLGSISMLMAVGITQDCSKRQLSMDQHCYTQDMLGTFRISNCLPVLTPIDPNVWLSAAMSPQTSEEKAEIVGVDSIVDRADVLDGTGKLREQAKENEIEVCRDIILHIPREQAKENEIKI